MERTFGIVFTSDTHGHIFPVDYAAGTPRAGGLLAMAAQVEKTGNTLVLDGGDALQGTPLVQYYLSHTPRCGPHPVAAAFNAMGCDYFTLGNHDFNFGYAALEEYLGAMRAQCVCANVQDLAGRLPIVPHAVHTLENGLRVGITGVVTDYVNVWEQPQNLRQLRVTDALEAARAALGHLRAQCEVCVCIYHGGFEEDLDSGRVLSATGENIACRLARELSFDLLLTGHQHMPVPGVMLAGTWAVQPPANAGQYVQVHGVHSAQGTRFSSALKAVGSRTQAQPRAALAPLEQAVQAWLDEPVGVLAEAVPPEEKLPAALAGSRVAELFNRVQLAATGADISCTSLGNEPVGLATPVTVRGVTAAYLFANTLVVLEVTREALCAALERCAAYFTLENGVPRISDEFLRPKVEHFNYDFYGGICYCFDLRRPVGSRLVRLTWPDGAPLGEGPFRLCTSNYRATGTGGYDALGRCQVLQRGSREVPELVVEYIRTHSPVPPLRCAAPEVIW